MKVSEYSTVCRKEICPGCEDTKNPKKHATCIRDSESEEMNAYKLVNPWQYCSRVGRVS